MATERTPEELHRYDEIRRHCREILDVAVENAASWMVADMQDMDPETCELWVDNVWNHLRGALDDEQRIHAILLLLDDRARARAHQILDGVS